MVASLPPLKDKTRLEFGSMYDKIETPDLLKIQKNSYQLFASLKKVLRDQS